MKLAVPCTWDKRLFSEITALEDIQNPIGELFGSLKISNSGTGHSSASLQADCNSRKEVEEYVKKLHEHGINFNYTINASCLGNNEFHPQKKKKLIEELEWICSFSDVVTVTVPYLIKLVNKLSNNRVKVAVSTIMGADNTNLINKLADLGVDRVVLNINLNRNLDQILRIREQTDITLELLVNDSCLRNCPYRLYHYNMGSHASTKNNEFYLDYCVYHCLRQRLEQPEEILRSPWLRPEDCYRYEGCIDYIKLGGREKDFDWVWRATKAYAQGKYEGNVIDLLTITSPDSHELGKLIFQNRLNLHLDSKDLDDYFKYFFEVAPKCDDCRSCNYCNKWTTKILHYSEEGAEYYKAVFNKLRLLLDETKIPGLIQHRVIKFVFIQYVRNTYIWKMIKSRIPRINFL